MQIKMSKTGVVFDAYKYALLLKDGQVLHSDGVEKFETPTSFIWLINPNNDSLDLSLIESLDNDNSHVWEINGTWSCIIQNRSNNSFRAISSIHNELSWYYSVDHPNIISNNLVLLSAQSGLNSIDQTGVASFLALAYHKFF